MLRAATFALAFQLVPILLTAQSIATNDDRKVAANPRYSWAVTVHRTPEAQLAEVEARLVEHPNQRSLYLPLAAKAALEAGDDPQAQSYADEGLELIKDKRSLQPFGGIVYYSHFVLGRIALNKGDVAEAKRELLQAGDTLGDPVLVSFGPNMSLARELLKRKEADTVLQFLEECRAFWKDENGRINRWEALIRNNQMPDFGPTLFL